MNKAVYFVAKFITAVDMFTFSLFASLQRALFARAASAFKVKVMKGSYHVANTYSIIDSDSPRRLNLPDASSLFFS
jgi:hypothetical protein